MIVGRPTVVMAASTMKRFLTSVLLALIVALPGTVRAQVLYGAIGSGNNAQLFTINPTTAATTYIATVNVSGVNLSLTGLAFQPGTGVLYGVTATHGSYAQTLVTIDLPSGAATLIGGSGGLGGTVTDITFDPMGTTLYGWQSSNGAFPNSAGIINLVTGAVSSLGADALFSSGGAIAIDPSRGIAYVARSGSYGALETLDLGTGNLGSIGVTMTTNGSYGVNLNAMAINGASEIYASNSTNHGPTNLMKLDPNTGVLTWIGALPDYTDALAFSTPAIPEPSTWAVIVGAAALGLAIIRRRRAT
jgi:hypothetical protein